MKGSGNEYIYYKLLKLIGINMTNYYELISKPRCLTYTIKTKKYH